MLKRLILICVFFFQITHANLIGLWRDTLHEDPCLVETTVLNLQLSNDNTFCLTAIDSDTLYKHSGRWEQSNQLLKCYGESCYVIGESNTLITAHDSTSNKIITLKIKGDYIEEEIIINFADLWRYVKYNVTFEDYFLRTRIRLSTSPVSIKTIKHLPFNSIKNSTRCFDVKGRTIFKKISGLYIINTKKIIINW